MRRDCKHYWMIESPDGHTVSRGECRYCGEVRFFLNVILSSVGRYRKGQRIPEARGIAYRYCLLNFRGDWGDLTRLAQETDIPVETVRRWVTESLGKVKNPRRRGHGVKNN